MIILQFLKYPISRKRRKLTSFWRSRAPMLLVLCADLYQKDLEMAGFIIGNGAPLKYAHIYHWQIEVDILSKYLFTTMSVFQKIPKIYRSYWKTYCLYLCYAFWYCSDVSEVKLTLFLTNCGENFFPKKWSILGQKRPCSRIMTIIPARYTPPN